MADQGREHRPLACCCGRDWMTWEGYARHQREHATAREQEGA